MSGLQSFLPYLPLLVFVAIPFFHWLFSTRLARKEDVEAMIAAERAAREAAIKGVTDTNAELAKAVTTLHADHRVLLEKLTALPTRDGLATVTENLARLSGLLEGRLQQIDRVQDAVERHDDIIADAARRRQGGER